MQYSSSDSLYLRGNFILILSTGFSHNELGVPWISLWYSFQWHVVFIFLCSLVLMCDKLFYRYGLTLGLYYNSIKVCIVGHPHLLPSEGWSAMDFVFLFFYQWGLSSRCVKRFEGPRVWPALRCVYLWDWLSDCQPTCSACSVRPKWAGHSWRRRLVKSTRTWHPAAAAALPRLTELSALPVEKIDGG